MSGLATAVSFYTRLPVPGARSRTQDLAAAVPWFPVVGAGVGVAVAGVYSAGAQVLPQMLAASLAVAAGAALTGAFHEDGLADVADAFAGGGSVDRRLEILDDPRLGTFGVIALVVSLLIRVTALASLDAYAALASLPAAHALSRAPAVVLMRRQPLARSAGLAASLAEGIGRAQETAAVGIALAVAALAIGLWAVPAAALALAVSAAMAALARKKIGGTNGDVLGASQQLVELAILVLAVAVVHEGWGDLAWWSR